MALTVTIRTNDVFGNKRCLTASIGFDSSYATGGESLTAAMLGLSAIDFLVAAPSSGYLFEYDHTNALLIARYPTKAQAVAASDANQPIATSGVSTASAVDATTPHITIPSGFRSAVDAGAGQEVTAAVDLSAITNCRIFVVGS